MSAEKKIRVGTWLPERLYRELQHRAIERREKVSDMIARAISELLKKEKS